MIPDNKKELVATFANSLITNTYTFVDSVVPEMTADDVDILYTAVMLQVRRKLAQKLEGQRL